MSTIALCIPAWNASQHLPRLLDSVKAQSQPFDEVWVHDDASRDETAEVAKAYGATVVRSSTNVGCSPGKNRLAEATRCEWIHFHDADESLQPEFVARARDWMERDRTDVVLFATEDRDDATGEILAQRTWDDAALVADPTRYCILNNVTNCGIYRRERFLRAGGFDTAEATRYNEDKAMHVRLALAGLRFRADSYRGVLIFRRPNSMSGGHPVECARAQYHVLREAAAKVGTQYPSEFGELLWRLAGVCGTYEDWRYAKLCVELASELGYRDPTNENKLFRLLAALDPMGAVVFRERMIRWLKPALRRGVPLAAGRS